MHKCMTDNLSIEPTEIKILIEFHYSSQRKFILNQHIFLREKKNNTFFFFFEEKNNVSKDKECFKIQNILHFFMPSNNSCLIYVYKF